MLVCVALLTSPFASSASADDSGAAWTPPVPGRLLRPFQEPVATYGVGHRGVDFAAPSGVAVRAANDGVVSFAGSVAGSLHVVVSHAGGIRTSYSFLVRVDVAVGQHVRRSQTLGAAGGTGDGHVAGVLHFGARIGDRYIDPMLLFRPTDLTQLVRLVPADERDAAGRSDVANEARALAESMLGHGGEQGESSCGDLVGGVATELGFGDEADSACDAVGTAVELALDAFRSAGKESADLANHIGPIVLAAVDRMSELGESLGEAAAAVAEEAAAQVAAAVVALAEYGKQLYIDLTSCPQPLPVAHPVGSGNFVVAVGGRDSFRRTRGDGGIGPSFHFEAKVLGYDDGDVSYFSYRATSATYEKADTYGDLHHAARLLGEQIKAAALAQPGRHLDLVAHSQGGVVIDLFLAEVYRGHESEYPRVENVVTFASPHEGTPLAQIGVSVAESPLGGPVERAANMDLDTSGLRQLSPDSPTMTHLRSSRHLPAGLRFLSIVGSEDAVVPSSSGDVPGGTKTVVPVGEAFVPDDHSSILRDPDALSAAQAQLSGGSPADTCGPLVDLASEAYTSAVTSAADLVDRIPGQSPTLTWKEAP